MAQAAVKDKRAFYRKELLNTYNGLVADLREFEAHFDVQVRQARKHKGNPYMNPIETQKWMSRYTDVLAPEVARIKRAVGRIEARQPLDRLGKGRAKNIRKLSAVPIRNRIKEEMRNHMEYDLQRYARKRPRGEEEHAAALRQRKSEAMWGVPFGRYRGRIPDDSFIVPAMSSTDTYRKCPGKCVPRPGVYCKQRGKKNDYIRAVYKTEQGKQLKGGAEALCVDIDAQHARTATQWQGAMWGDIPDALRQQIPPNAIVFPRPPGFYGCTCPPGKKPKTGVQCVGVQTKWVKPSYIKKQTTINKKDACM